MVGCGHEGGKISKELQDYATLKHFLKISDCKHRLLVQVASLP